jgi:hypothetical protein
MPGLPHNPGGEPLLGVLYLKHPQDGTFVAIPIEVSRYTLQQHAQIRKTTGAVEPDTRMPIIVYGTALGIIEDPEYDPFTARPITQGE